MTAARSARLGAGLVATAFVVLWCTGYPAAKIALGHTGPFVLLTLRFGGAALVYGTLALLARAPWPRGRQALHSVAIGTLQLALQFGGVYLAAARGVSVGLIALVIGTMPIATALIGRVFGERVVPLQWLGFVFGFGGVALAVGESLRPGAAADWVAYLAMILGLIGIASGTVYQKRCGSQIDLRSGLALQHAVAALLLLPGAALEGWRWDGSAAAFVTLGWLIVVRFTRRLRPLLSAAEAWRGQPGGGAVLPHAAGDRRARLLGPRRPAERLPAGRHCAGGVRGVPRHPSARRWQCA